jgi:hypothetical protein
MIRIVSVVRSTDLVVSSSWDDEYVTVPTPHSHAVLQDRVHFEEVASSGSAETRAEKSFNESLAVEVETRFWLQFLLPRRCNSNSTVVYRVLDPSVSKRNTFFQSFAGWPAVTEQLDDTLLMG